MTRVALPMALVGVVLAGCGRRAAPAAPAPAPVTAPAPAPAHAPAGDETERLKQVIAESQYHADLGAV
ncbi:MAG: hypothetical protein ACYTGX_17015, partial [Planctomycetota bacterium]